MITSNPIRAFISDVRRDFSSIGTRTTVFVVRTTEGGHEYVSELDDLDFTFLHEELISANAGSPNLSLSKFRLFDTLESVEERRVVYEKYLNEALESPVCVDQSILWVTLGLPVSTAVRQRFLIRGDNVDQLEQLSSIAAELGSLANASFVNALLRLLRDQAWDVGTVASGTMTLSRISAQLDTSRLLVETSTVPGLIRALFLSSSFACIGLLSDLASALASSHPQTLFVYFQRDGGLTELIDMLDTQDVTHPRSLLSLAEILWSGVSSSKDVEIALTDKSSVGMSLLNRLLVKGQGSETELVVTTILSYLYVRGLVPEYGAKILTIVDSVLADASVYRLRFADNFLRILVLLGKPDSSPSDELIVKLACHLVVSKTLTDELFFDRSQVKILLSRRLKQLVFGGPDLSESTRARAAEALVMVGLHEPLSPDLVTALEMEKHVKTLLANSLGAKIQKLNNFFIEANFDLSSRAIATPIGGSHGAALGEMTGAVAGLLGAIDEEQKSLNGIHSRALNEVVSGMFQVKSLLKEVETVANTDLCHQFQSVISNAGEQRGKLESLEKELRECIEQLKSESNEDSKAALRKRVSELKVNTNKATISDLTELNDKRNAGLCALRHVNRELMRLNGDTFASLVDAVAQIDQRVAGSGTKIHQLKSVLVKMKNEIDDLLEQIDEDTGSSPVSP